MIRIYITVACLISVTLAQVDDSLFSGKTLPPELQQKLNETEIENVKAKYMEQFKKKCEKNGHPEVYDDIQVAIQTFTACASALVDMNKLQEEIEEAKPNGKVDEVFKEYCGKTPELKNCFRNVTETVKPCFAPDEQKNFKVLYNVTDQLAEFICFKDGDRIALFIAEGGQECFQEMQEPIQNCFNQTFDSQTKSSLQNVSFESILELEFKEKQCNQMTELKTCLYEVLNQCVKPTSANIVDSLFDFVRKATPCNNFSKAKKSAHDAASGLAVTSGTIFMALAAAILI